MGFDVNEQGRVISYGGTLPGTTLGLQRTTYILRSIPDETGTAGYVTDVVNGSLGGAIGVEITDGSSTTRGTLEFRARP